MTTYLHFDLGPNREAYQQVLDEIRRHSAKPNDLILPAETANHYTIAAPIHMRSELETLVSSVGRLVDEMDYDPCTIELRRVLAQISPDGTLVTTPAANGTWEDADTKYIATDPRVTELHHVVTVPKRGSHPPAPPDGWSFTERPDAWHFELRKPAKVDLESAFRRDRDKAASLYKGMEGAKIASRLEQVVARWSSPLEPTEKNQYRVSSRRLIGASLRNAPDIPEIYAEIQNNHAQSFLGGDLLRARILANLEPCRRIARAQGFTPWVLGIGLIPVVPENGRLKFSDGFCVRGVSYGRTQEEAEALISAFDELMYYLVKFGRSPMLSPPERYGDVSLWRDLLASPSSPSAPTVGAVGEAQARQRAASRNDRPTRKKEADRNFTATIERVHAIVPSHQYKPLDEVARNLLSQWFGAKFDLRDLGILGIPIRTEPDANGRRIGGCLFALVHAPNLDLAKLNHLVVCESLFLRWGPVKLTQPSNTKESLPDARAELIQWALDHDLLRRTVIALRKEKPGTKLNHMRTDHTKAYALYLKYSLQSFESEIENTTKIGTLMKELWRGMTGKDPSYLFHARKLAGLPSLKPPKQAKAAKR